jgi:hypothetical protein
VAAANASHIMGDAEGCRAGGCDVKGDNHSDVEVAAVAKARGAGKDDSVGGNNGDILELGDSSRMYPLHHPSAVPSCIVSKLPLWCY